MRRLFLYLRGLSWGACLQLLVVAMILGRLAWIDFQIGRSSVTIGIALTSWLIGWLLKRVMVANPQRTSKTLNVVGFVVLAFYVLTWKQWWWRLRLAHYASEFVLWLDFSCGYWFVSELQLERQQILEPPDPWEDRADKYRGDDRFG